jgi:hypothetical protein
MFQGKSWKIMARAEMILCEDQWDSKKSHCHMSVLVPFGFAVFCFLQTICCNGNPKVAVILLIGKVGMLQVGVTVELHRTPLLLYSAYFCLLVLLADDLSCFASKNGKSNCQ